MFKGHFYQLKPGGGVVSDTHFGHKNIIKYSRPQYHNIKEMHEFMIDEWNSVVQHGDKVIHLGDVALGLKKDELTKIIGRLNGTKMLIPGNHDRHVLEEHRHYFNDVGFKNVEVGVNQIEIERYVSTKESHIMNNEVSRSFILSHEPLAHIPAGFINIHGHVHDGMTAELYGMDSRRINVCGDAIKKEGK